MTPAQSPLPGSRALIVSAVTALVALAGLAFATGDALVGRSFEQAFAAAGPGPGNSAQTASGAVAGLNPNELWLAGHEGNSLRGMPMAARVGERISLATDRGAPVEFEIVGVSEIAAPRNSELGSASGRLVMVTCRETGSHEGNGRVIRFILDGNEPLGGAAGTSARAL
jgi:hypothetical protein